MTHGDIKPQNILMFEEKAFQKKPRFIYAKLADFGYAGWCVDESKDILYPARSRPWEPPEYHHRGFLLREAKRIDIYCFGLLCLWILFEETLSSSRMSFLEDLTGNKTHGPLINLHPGKEFYDIDCIYQLKNDDLLPTLAGHLIRAEATLSIQQKQTLLFFFTSSLAYDPTIRPTTLDQLASVLDQEW
jgi:serine/threonine protein kinase